MRIEDICRRSLPPAPWQEGDNIPWDEPGFSARMLREHLSQEHDLASRRTAKVDRHVEWIRARALGGGAGRVLDVTCGPGLYTSRLARAGCTCVGVDFSPASVEHARIEAGREGLTCTYRHEDVRTAELGSGFDLAMMLHGQLNVFPRPDARELLRRLFDALCPGGRLVLEPQRASFLAEAPTGAGSSWQAEEGPALFSDRPHLVLQEAFWDEEERTRTERFYVIDAASGAVSRHALSSVAYQEGELLSELEEAGFGEAEVHPSLVGEPDDENPWNFVVLARRPAG